MLRSLHPLVLVSSLSSHILYQQMSEGGDSVPDSPHESSSDHSEMHSKPPASSVPISLSTKSASPLPDSYHARLTKSISQGDGILSISEPNGWWGSRDASRPWRERMEPQRRRTIPPEQTERWERTHNVRMLLSFCAFNIHRPLSPFSSYGFAI